MSQIAPGPYVKFGSVTGQVMTHKGLTFCIDKSVNDVYNTNDMYSKLAHELSFHFAEKKLQGMPTKKYIESMLPTVTAQDVKKTQKAADDLEKQIEKEIAATKATLVKERKKTIKPWTRFDDDNAEEDAIHMYDKSTGKQTKKDFIEAAEIAQVSKIAFEGKNQVEEKIAQKQKWYSGKAFCIHDGCLYVWLLLPEAFTAKQTQTVYPDGYNLAYRLEKGPANIKTHIACIPLKVANDLQIYMTAESVHTQNPIPKEYIYTVTSFKEKATAETATHVVTTKKQWTITQDKHEYKVTVEPLGLLAKVKFW